MVVHTLELGKVAVATTEQRFPQTAMPVRCRNCVGKHRRSAFKLQQTHPSLRSDHGATLSGIQARARSRDTGEEVIESVLLQNKSQFTIHEFVWHFWTCATHHLEFTCICIITRAHLIWSRIRGEL